MSYHENIINRLKASNLKDIQISIKEGEKGIIDIKFTNDENNNLENEGYKNKGNGLYIKRIDKQNINIFEFNEFITGIHYLNELICTYDEMTNNNPINDYFKNTKNIYYNNKQCLYLKNDEYKNYEHQLLILI